MFKGKRLFNFGRRDAASPSQTYETENVEQGYTPVESKPAQSSFNKIVIVGVVALTLLATVVFYGVKKNQASDIQKEEEQFMIKEHARFEAEQAEYLGKREELLTRFQKLSRDRNEVIGMLKGNYETAVRNQKDFQTMFAEKKAEFDDDADESIDTAFMLKEDVEKKKQDMIQEGKNLGVEKERLLQTMQGIKKELTTVANTYNQSYDGEKLPLA